MTYNLRNKAGSKIVPILFRDINVGSLFRLDGDSEVVYMRIDRPWAYVSLRSGNTFETAPDKSVTPLEPHLEVVLSRGK